jgi:hypothetical protein
LAQSGHTLDPELVDKLAERFLGEPDVRNREPAFSLKLIPGIIAVVLGLASWRYIFRRE